MKKLFLFTFVCALTMTAYSQVETPAASPFQKIEQKVGLSTVTLEYSRPSMKGRKIFGGLVPYEKVWRTGANANTKITFSDDVIINEKTVKAGTYAIYTKPSQRTWDIYFYADANNWGTPQEWDESKVVAGVKVNTLPMPMNVETFTMTFDNIKGDRATLGMLWENVYVGIPINFMTDEAVTANIERVMGGPTANDYYASAVYYLEAGKDIKKAKMWIDKAIEMRDEPAFWYYRQQSLIYAKSGDKKGAIAAAKKSLDLATKAGNEDYIALNKKSLGVWEGRPNADK